MRGERAGELQGRIRNRIKRRRLKMKEGEEEYCRTQ